MIIRTGTCLAAWIVAGLGLGAFTGAQAQSFEEEPNDTCAGAQDVGLIDIPFTLEGTLDESVERDVDFYRFVAEPGIELSVEQKGQWSDSGTLEDPYLGWFDSACQNMDLNDDYLPQDSRLIFTVPPDGEFVIAASSFRDLEFDGSGSSKGSYRLSISEAPPVIGSISAFAVDARTGEPLPGDFPLYTSFALFACGDGGCPTLLVYTPLAYLQADSGGRVSFVRDDLYSGEPLRAGTYQVSVGANGYGDVVSEPFAVEGGEDFDLGTLFLEPPPISVSGIVACESLPSEGGTCRYEVRLDNNTPDPVRGLVWSLVSGFGLDSDSNLSTTFEASPKGRQDKVVPRRRLRLGSFGGQTFGFGFTVPPSVPDGAEFCTQLLVGTGADPLYHIAASRGLFCVTKGADGLRPVSGQGAAKLRAGQMRDNRMSVDGR